jgi:hypothetical protein
MNHKQFFIHGILLVLVVLLTACAKTTPEQVEGRINPGDKIGDFLITMGEEGDITYLWEIDDSACVKQGDAEVYSCQVTVGTKVNVSVGIYDDTYSGKLDLHWSGLIYEMLIDDRPVNLDAFGSIDVSHPSVGTIRAWNVVINTTQPGEITVSDKGAEHDGTPIESTTKYTFNAP